ncbi:MAG TPA: imidazolonepropionase [Gammaproteobacteria bacterium]|nr:imidazolonepropionase [Gammaproteobacteria bacterium]
MYDLLIKNARLYPLLTDTSPVPARTLAVNDGRIAALGVPEDTPAREVFDARDRLLLPGLMDCHTHALYAGDRMAEHVQKMQGASYADIARAGGGIQTTVAAVRAASEQQLLDETLPRLAALRAEGVTCVEIKSGYGLDAATELKMLRAIRSLRRHIDMDISATFLGAHAVPKERFREDYFNEVIEKMLPVVAEEKLADSVDIFVEHIAFTPDDMQHLFERAAKLGLHLRVHSDQLSNLGATALAAECGALSCDHLEYSNETDVAAMAMHGTVAVLLPAAFYFLRESRKPPVGLLREHGVPMAVASDLNPGSAPVASLLTAMHMAGILFGLTPAEILLGVTKHAARVLGRADRAGALAPGYHADFALWDLPAPEFLCYQLGGLKPETVFFKGKPS